MLPAETAPLVQSPSLVAQVAAQSHNSKEVGDDDRAGGAIGQRLELLGNPAVGLAGLVAHLLLGQVGLGARLVGGLAGLVLETDAVGLRVGLDLLLQEVRGDGMDGLGVDVDQARGGG